MPADSLIILCKGIPQSTGTNSNVITGIHHVAVHVRDLDRMLKFYSEAFGFERVG